MLMAPGNDGYTGHFSIACWDVIKMDMGNFIQDFFEGSYIPKEISSTTLVLLPKVEHARNMGDFCPISLGNFCRKIVSKIFASRLAKILPDIVDEEHAGFIRGRSIATHVVLAQELIRDINRKVTRGNVALKLDMAKAYDRLEWHFLLRTMKAFGFSPQVRDLIYWNICNIWYSFRIYGEYYDSFRSFRGVRQGDPLSPLLFVLAQQVLSNNLKRLTTQLDIKPYHIGQNEKPITHLFHVDDVLLFTNGAARSLRTLMSLLREYQASSGQQINIQKSTFYVGSKAMHRASSIAAITVISQRPLPFNYLRVPIFYGKMKVFFYEHLVEKVRSRLEGWKARIFSFGDRISLIHAVLRSIPIYSSVSSLVAKSVLRRIDRLMANF